MTGQDIVRPLDLWRIYQVVIDIDRSFGFEPTGRDFEKLG